MLKVYCHYSYAGYKFYNLAAEGVKEITSSDRHGLSKSSVTYFSRFGLKEAFVPLPEGGWMLLVHDIPTDDLDDVGRKKTCSLQMIADDRVSRLLLAKLAVIIANEMVSFEKFFASLFTIGDVLEFDYASFSKFLKGIDNEVLVVEKPWDRVYGQGAPLLLYSGNTLSSSIKEVSHLISNNDILKSVSTKWDPETCKPASMKVMKYVYDIIQRLLDKLKIWND